jgi:hypothetical protein
VRGAAGGGDGALAEEIRWIEIFYTLGQTGRQIGEREMEQRKRYARLLEISISHDRRRRGAWRKDKKTTPLSI